MADVHLQNVCKSFNGQRAVDCISLDIQEGEFVSLVGPSGCGKTTVLRMIAGLEEIDRGELYVGGRLYNHLPARSRGVAMVFQSYALFPHMTVMENLAFGLKIKKVPKAEARKKIQWAIQLIGLEGLERRYPRELSGGQRQRVALGRSLVLDPKVLLLDEPLSNLDAALRDRMTAELKRLHRQIGKTIIYVTHNQIEAMTLSNRIAIIRNGRLIQCDTPNRMYNFPSQEFVATFVGTPTMNIFSATVETENSSVWVRVGNVKLKMDQSAAENLRKYNNQTVRVGIRPQHIYHHLTKVGRRHSDTQIMVEVDIVEALGDKDLVVAKLGKTPLVFLVDPDMELNTGQKMGVVIDGRKMHFFEKESRERLFQ